MNNMEKINDSNSKKESNIDLFSIISKFNEVTNQDIENFKKIGAEKSLIEGVEKIFEKYSLTKKQKMAFVYYKLSDEEINFILTNTVPGFSDHHNFENILYEVSVITNDDKYKKMIEQSTKHKEYLERLDQINKEAEKKHSNK
jgi:hypothetical protein